MTAPKSVQATLDLKVLRLSGTCEPDNAELKAAWELYVELVTRVGVVPLVEGHSRDALASLYSLFETTRKILKHYGPDVAQVKGSGTLSFGYLAIGMLNNLLRPLLSYWHPELGRWEEERPLGRSVAEHERNWSRDLELREALHQVGIELRNFVDVLAAVCRVPDARNIPAG